MKEKYEQSTANEKNVVGKEQNKVAPSSEVILMFKQNRKFELRIGRNYYIFNGREKVKVPRSVVEHPDFTHEIQKYFVVQEIK